MEFLVTIKPIVIIVHAFAGAIGVGATTVTDTLFFRFLSDRIISPKEKSTMEAISGILWTALVILIITGVLLFFADTAKYLASSKFVLKMIIVGIIALNGILLSRYISPRMSQIRFNTKRNQKMSLGLKRLAFVSGVVSLSSWYAAFLLGMLDKIPLTIGQGFAIYAGVIVVGACVSMGLLRYFSKK